MREKERIETSLDTMKELKQHKEIYLILNVIVAQRAVNRVSTSLEGTLECRRAFPFYLREKENETEKEYYANEKSRERASGSHRCDED